MLEGQDGRVRMSQSLINLALTSAFDSTAQRLEFSHLMAALVESGALTQASAMKVCMDLSEQCRELRVQPQIEPYRDLRALHYEDIASRLGGGDLLVRDAGQ